ncbi:NADH-quinone oxidoreductase subunit J [Prevotella sp. HUN102]|uniref:NADH-quinone oxidoreductase subunit J family protein n=1 Tax=Prevotella sp. HUN102 TaxID=1392486 RepID=UPI00048B9D67|nr:NADH-quinone oxidoreductase subunit J [Prevotella sp. HUN102]
MAKLIVFAILAAVILGSAVFCVSTKRIMRAATALLFVLFGVAGLYFLLDYTFLGAAQISIYAGGITVMYIFAIQLVSKRTLQGLSERWLGKRSLFAGIIALIGAVTVVGVSLKNKILSEVISKSTVADTEVSMEVVGKNLMSADKFGYVLPFEFISVFLLACIIGGLVILNIRKKEEVEK